MHIRARGGGARAPEARSAGPDGSVSYDAAHAAAVYNSANDEYLVVWEGDDNTGLLVDGELESFGQRVNAASGAEIGGDLRLSDMGPDGDMHFDAFYSAAAYNSASNEYLVVWEGDDDTGLLADNEYESFGQRVNAASERRLGATFG